MNSESALGCPTDTEEHFLFVVIFSRPLKISLFTDIQ